MDVLVCRERRYQAQYWKDRYRLPDTFPLLDVSRLVWRAWEGTMPTGIDRTCLAYVAHFGDRARAVVQRGGSTLVLPTDDSRRLFDLLAAPGSDFRAKLARLLAAGFLFRRRGDLSGHIYLNVGHTGLDKPGHREWIQRTGVNPSISSMISFR